MKRLHLRDITEQPASVDLYASREKIQPRRVRGRYTRLRQALGLLLVGLFLALPWLRWNGQPALWIDLGGRRLQWFGATFWPEDLGLLAGALIVAAFALFWVTVLAGRVWCGYACPQTVWTAIFLWCERITEGDRLQRLRLDREPASLEKLARRLAKHLLWALVSLVTGFTLVALFVPVTVLLPGLPGAGLGSVTRAWLLGIAVATYANAGWLREQLCVYLCPYSRFQAVMFDTATPVVSYDHGRGEPRGSRRDNSTAGDCVDCTLCVQVCPTGIDIRDGLQIACIACGACVDACDTVMAKVERPLGLIAYRSEATQAGQPTQRRPRLLGYGLVLLFSAMLLAFAIASRPLVSFTVSKDRQLFRDTGNGRIENVYSLTLMNKDQHPHTYRLSASGPSGLTWRGPTSLRLGAGEQRTEVIGLALPYEQATSQPLRVRLDSDTGGKPLNLDSRFTGPQP